MDLSRLEKQSPVSREAGPFKQVLFKEQREEMLLHT